MLNKILFTIFAIIALWKAYALIARLQKQGGVLARNSGREPPRRPAERQGEPKAVELVPCPRCGAYVDPRERCGCLTGRA
jgi:hypothetical protein